MNRFVSLVTAAVLAGSLLGSEGQVKADSTLYLVPISDLNATYAPGSSVQFAAVCDLGVRAIDWASTSAPTAIAYTTAQFGVNQPTAVYDTSEDQANPGALFWDAMTPIVYHTTASKVNGATVQTIFVDPGHFRRFGTNGDLNAKIFAGVHTIATFTFPISPTIKDSVATVYLPTPYGFSNSSNSTDGFYINGRGPALTLYGVDVQDNRFSDPLTFPNSGGKYSALSFRVGAVPEPGAMALLAGITTLGAALLRKRRKR